MDWATILTSLGASAVGSGILAGLIMLWLNHRLANEREALKSELNRISEKDTIQFTKLQDKRSEAIFDVHQKMMSINGHIYVASNARPGNTDHISNLEQAEKFWLELDKATLFYTVYFEQSLCDDILKFSEITKWQMAHQAGEQHRPIEFSTDSERQLFEQRDQRYADLELESYQITKKVMNQFRSLLGVTPEELPDIGKAPHTESN